MRFIMFFAALIGLGVITIYANYGTIEPCSILRTRMRESALHESRFGGFIANAMPDSVLNAIIAAQYGPLTPAKCVSILLGRGGRPPTGPFATPTGPTLPPAPSRQARPAESPYANPLWDNALVDLFGRDANAVYDKTGQKKHAVWFAYPYQDGDMTLYSVFAKTLVENPTDGLPSECHACGMLIGVATYQQQGKQWSLQSVQSNVGTFGEWGKVPDVDSPEKLKFTASDFALLIDFDEYHTGETVRGKGLLNRTANGWRFIGDIITHEDYAGSVQLRFAYDSALSLVPQPNESYPVIRVVRVGTEYDEALRQVVPASTVFYAFDGEKYIEQRHQP